MKPFDEIERQFPEIKHAIIDVLEDALMEKGATIPNEERDREIAEGEDPECLAIIFGSDYDLIGDEITDAIRRYCLSEPKESKVRRLVNGILDAFLKIVTKTVFPDDRFSETDMTVMRHRIENLLVKYEILDNRDTEGIRKVLNAWSAGKEPFNRVPKANME